MKFLVCGVPCTLIRASKLQNRASAPPLQAENLPHGVVTMRCDISTCSSARVSFLVSGSVQTCFDDKLLLSRIKNEIIEKRQLVRALSNSEDNKPSSYEPLPSMCVACGASTFEVWITLPKWAAQVLKYLAPEISYRSLVALGITWVNGTPVSSFDRQDADRLLFFCSNQCKDKAIQNVSYAHLSSWSASLTKDRTTGTGSIESKQMSFGAKGVGGDNKMSLSSLNSRLKPATMRPIPHSSKVQMHPFMRFAQSIIHDASQVKTSLPAPPVKDNTVPVIKVTQRKSSSGSPSSSSRVQPSILLNPLPMKKHECNRLPINICSEEDFLKDVMQFLLQRGHDRLVPQGGLAEFPDAVLNSKRLDLYNLYKEVVYRGGFHVGNGINWKGQVFSKMRNHTVTNKMMGVGNTLKRHYETYLLEYELAHDDIEGECCLFCHRVNLGCDRRQGLGNFKDYSKTDGLEYICPKCSHAKYEKPPLPVQVGNGLENTTSAP